MWILTILAHRAVQKTTTYPDYSLHSDVSSSSALLGPPADPEQPTAPPDVRPTILFENASHSPSHAGLLQLASLSTEEQRRHPSDLDLGSRVVSSGEHLCLPGVASEYDV
jgi:hypothetical protein